MQDADNTRSGLRRVWQTWTTELLPQACVVCGKSLLRDHLPREICRSCLAQMPHRFASVSLMASDLSAYSSLSLPPRLKLTWQNTERLIVAFSYKQPLPQLISQLKFGHRPDIALPLAFVLAKAIQRSGVVVDFVAPIPLSPKRLHERGYNQAALIAEVVAQMLKVPCLAHFLRRKRESKRQSEVKGVRGRISNVMDLFEINQETLTQDAQLRDKPLRHCLLIDDVLTTGSTWLAALKPLRQAGYSVSGGFLASEAINTLEIV